MPKTKSPSLAGHVGEACKSKLLQVIAGISALAVIVSIASFVTFKDIKVSANSGGACLEYLSGTTAYWYGEGSYSDEIAGYTPTFSGVSIVQPPEPRPFPDPGASFAYSGTTSSSVLNQANLMNPINGFAVSFWYSDANPGFGQYGKMESLDPFSGQPGPGPGWVIRYWGPDMNAPGNQGDLVFGRFQDFPGNWQGAAVNQGPVANTWTHVVAVYDPFAPPGMQDVLYVNGQPSQISLSQPYLNPGGPLRLTIGGFTGLTDEMFFFNRPLSAMEVSVLYGAGRAANWVPDSALCGGSPQPFCGDGEINQSSEQCEPPNTQTCDANCQTIVAEYCGDGIINSMWERCDDGNSIDGDGCNHHCYREGTGGNGVVEAYEQCDDGNYDNNDGCSETYQIENQTCLATPGSLYGVAGNDPYDLPVVWWDFDQYTSRSYGQSDILHDLGGRLDLTEEFPDAVTPAAGLVGQAGTWTGYTNSDYLGQDEGLLALDEFTVSFWLKVDTANLLSVDYPVVSHRGDAGGWEVGTYIGMGRGIIFKLYGGNGQEVSNVKYPYNNYGGNVFDGNWHLITATYNGSIARLFVDTHFEENSISGFVPASGSALVRVGYGNVSQLDEVVIFGDDLSDNIIQSIYNSYANGICKPNANVCGNYTVEAGEQCEPPMSEGCDSLCQIYVGPVCGNGAVEEGEECDDGNNTSGDGCSATCALEIVCQGNDNDADLYSTSAADAGKVCCGIYGDHLCESGVDCNDGFPSIYPGSTQEQACGDGQCGGEQTRTCQDDGTWSAYSSCDYTVSNGNSCDDGAYCTTEDYCDAGQCVGGATRYCQEDGNVCTLSQCDEDNNRCWVFNEGYTASCYDGGENDSLVDPAICRAGTRTCIDGYPPQLGACTGQVLPEEYEYCDAGLQDENCNGTSNEECACYVGQQQECGTDVGQCQKGAQVCGATGQWGETCVGEVGPTLEICDGLDNDCNGTIDDGCPKVEKFRALVLLQALQTDKERTRQELDKAIDALVQSMNDPRIHWINSTSVACAYGNKVFDFEAFTVEKLMKLLDPKKQQHYDASIAESVATAITYIVGADRGLAHHMITQANSSESANQMEIDHALERLAIGDEEREAGDRDKAIREYKKAWQHAMRALNKDTGCDYCDLDLDDENYCAQ